MKILKATCFKTCSSGNLPILAIPTAGTNTLTECHSLAKSRMEMRVVWVMDGQILSRCQEMHKWNFIYSCKESMAFTLVTSQNSVMLQKNPFLQTAFQFKTIQIWKICGLHMPKRSKPGAYNQLWLCFKKWIQNFYKLTLHHREKNCSKFLTEAAGKSWYMECFTEKV